MVEERREGGVARASAGSRPIVAGPSRSSGQATQGTVGPTTRSASANSAAAAALRGLADHQRPRDIRPGQPEAPARSGRRWRGRTGPDRAGRRRRSEWRAGRAAAASVRPRRPRTARSGRARRCGRPPPEGDRRPPTRPPRPYRRPAGGAPVNGRRDPEACRRPIFRPESDEAVGIRGVRPGERREDRRGVRHAPCHGGDAADPHGGAGQPRTVRDRPVGRLEPDDAAMGRRPSCRPAAVGAEGERDHAGGHRHGGSSDEPPGVSVGSSGWRVAPCSGCWSRPCRRTPRSRSSGDDGARYPESRHRDGVHVGHVIGVKTGAVRDRTTAPPAHP